MFVIGYNYKIDMQKMSSKNNNAHPFLGFDQIAELLIQKGANINVVGSEGNTALIWAAKNGKK